MKSNKNMNKVKKLIVQIIKITKIQNKNIKIFTMIKHMNQDKKLELCIQKIIIIYKKNILKQVEH